MHNYADAHGGKLPPAVVYGKNGEPLYSWRVLILPYIDEQLFEEFHLDEPWDSAHNLKLLPHMPSVYGLPPRKQALLKPGETFCHLFVGNGTPFKSRDGLSLKSLFKTGNSSGTIMIIEAGEPTPWTKPEDILYDADKPLELRSVFKDIYRLLLFDGSRHHIKKETSEANLRALVEGRGNVDDCK